MPNTSPRVSAERRIDRRMLAVLGAIALVATVLVFGSVGTGAETHQVVIEGMVYSPATADAKIGDRVTFTNRDMMPHTVTGKDFDSGAIPPGGSWTLTIEQEGTVDYRCIYHPLMTGSLRIHARTR